MFRKKQKTRQPPPEPPTADEICDDLETFHVAKPLPQKSRHLDDKASLDDWWQYFETFLEDLNDMKHIKTSLNGYKINLESSKLEIETMGKNIENDIEDNLGKTKDLLDKIPE